MKNRNNYDVGVIVGRFQVDKLHDGHIDLIQSVVNNHSKVIIFLGLTPLKCTYRNPLDFEARKQMILNSFPDVIISYIKDMSSDTLWSKELDSKIIDLIGPNQTVVLYGGRDAFIKNYNGKFNCIELEQKIFVKGTDIRKEISNKVKSSSDFRKGVIWATANQFINPKPTIDIAIVDEYMKNVLLGKKQNEKHFRFIGGFVDINENWETAARREALEETGLEIAILKYIGSFVIDDWRYKSEKGNITTSFFIAKKVFGAIEPMDDIEILEWIEIEKLEKNKYMIIETHLELLNSFLENITKIKMEIMNG